MGEGQLAAHTSPVLPLELQRVGPQDRQLAQAAGRVDRVGAIAVRAECLPEAKARTRRAPRMASLARL